MFGVFHTEGFLRHRSAQPTALSRNLAVRERLIDLASIFMYGKPIMPAVLSSCEVFWQTSTGIIIPVHKFKEYEKNHGTLRAYLSRHTYPGPR